MEIMFTGATNDLTRENQETTMTSGKAHYRNLLKAKTSTFSPPLDNYYSLISNQNSSQPETKPPAFSFSNCSPLKLFSFFFLSSQKPILRETFFYSFSLSWQPENHTCTSSLFFFSFYFFSPLIPECPKNQPPFFLSPMAFYSPDRRPPKLFKNGNGKWAVVPLGHCMEMGRPTSRKVWLTESSDVGLVS